MKKKEFTEVQAYHLVTAAWKYLDEPVRRALMSSLSDQRLAWVRETMADEPEAFMAQRIVNWRKDIRRQEEAADPVNLPAVALLEDYEERRKGKIVGARKQLRRRFDGLDHDLQVAVAKAFLNQSCQTDRDFMYKKLASGVFWDDCLTEIVENLWVETQDRRLAVVVARRARKEFVQRHFGELQGCCSYSDLCLKIGEVPDKDRLSPWTYLYVMSKIGGDLKPREGRQAVFGLVLQHIRESDPLPERLDIYEIPHVSRMLLYLGIMKELDEIIAIQRTSTHLSEARPDEWEGIIVNEL